MGVVLILAAGACGSDDQLIVAPTPTIPPSTAPELTTTTTAAPEPTTTTTEPEPTTTTVYVAPATTVRVRATTTTVTAGEYLYEQTTVPATRPTTSDVWWQLALCESGGANVDTGNGYSGYFQFLDSTWRSVGYSGRAVDYSYDTQVAGAQTLQARSGWGQWPSCSRQLGLR